MTDISTPMAAKRISGSPPLTDPASPPLVKLSTAGGGLPALEVAESFEALSLDQDAWDAVAARWNAPVYMTHAWLRTWWDHYGRGLALRLFVFRRGEQIVGLLPMYLEDFGWGPWRTRVARLVGASLPPKTFNPPVDPEKASGVWQRLYEHLFTELDCDLLSLGPVARTWKPGDAVAEACRECSGLIGSCSFTETDKQTVFELPESYEGYLKTLGSKERQNLLRRQRQLEKERPVQAETITEEAAAGQAFDEFALLHARQWQTMGKGGHFTAWPGAAAYNRELALRQARLGRTRFYRLQAGPTLISSRYAYFWNDTLYCELPARIIGEAWDRLGIGGLAILKLYETCLASGIRRFDTGLGEYEHKTRLGGVEIPVGIWRVVRAGAGSRIKTAMLLLWSRTMKLLFHKVWYSRIVPKLPGRFGRTQKRCWLRFSV